MTLLSLQVMFMALVLLIIMSEVNATSQSQKQRVIRREYTVAPINRMSLWEMRTFLREMLVMVVNSFMAECMGR